MIRTPIKSLILSVILPELLAASPANTVTAGVEQTADLRLTLPDAFHTVAGQRISIWFDNIVLTESSEHLRFDVTCDVGELESRRWTFVPATDDAGSHAISVIVRNVDGMELSTASTTLHVVAPDAGQGRTLSMLIVGDSLTHARSIPTKWPNCCRNPAIQIGRCWELTNRRTQTKTFGTKATAAGPGSDLSACTNPIPMGLIVNAAARLSSWIQTTPPHWMWQNISIRPLQDNARMLRFSSWESTTVSEPTRKTPATSMLELTLC